MEVDTLFGTEPFRNCVLLTVLDVIVWVVAIVTSPPIAGFINYPPLDTQLCSTHYSPRDLSFSVLFYELVKKAQSAINQSFSLDQTTFRLN